METNRLDLLYKTLDDVRHQNGIEFWYARDLYPLLGYSRWENFLTAIERAKEACENGGGDVNSHFRDVTKKAKVGLDLEKDIQDIKLTRYASYLVAVNGDPRKQEVAFAQAYFVTQTRNMEVLQQKMDELERIGAREKLTVTEKAFAAMAFSRGVDGRGISEIRSFGDQALFGGRTTDDMKRKLGVAKTKPLADVLPKVTIIAKELATAMTTENARRKNISGKGGILNEHVMNNRNIREALIKTDIYPESLPASESIKKIEMRHHKEIKELQKKHKQELAEATNR